MKRLLIIAGLMLACLLRATPAMAQDQEAALFAGYSFMRVDQDGADDGNTHGGEVDYTYFLDRRFGFTLSASGHWGDLDAAPNVAGADAVDFRQYTFLVGPHAVLHRSLTSEIGVRALGGAAWRRLDTKIGGIRLADDTDPAWAIQAHVDFRLSDHIWLRALQPSVVWTRFDGKTRANWRVTVGLTLLSGEILQ